ncbi:MAG: hypothetical protein IPL15_23955 [Comamonadaceae bacterium]|nr:hypothetical protein [Comamonadaceae bacterium]
MTQSVPSAASASAASFRGVHLQFVGQRRPEARKPLLQIQPIVRRRIASLLQPGLALFHFRLQVIQIRQSLPRQDLDPGLIFHTCDVLDTHEISECQLALAQLGLRGLGRNQAALAPQRNGHPLHQGLLQRAHGLLLPHQLRQQGVELGPAFTRQDQVTAQDAVLGCVGAAGRLARRRAGAGALERVLPVGFLARTGRWHGSTRSMVSRMHARVGIQLGI